ncbi:MAG: ribosome biogenesis GTP-binding protein YihA/YsxC [Elusimicrobia bacterium]|nr:ribosome biogenesis GTP-binding protein YihA/YsxC [Elusimicrobiota bacterium]
MSPLPLADMKFLLSAEDPARIGPCAAEAAFVGRSNVGKSSLLNALCRMTMARVSGTPGCTRTINVFQVGRERWLVDLPGYGFASGPRAQREGWGPMIEGYLTGRPGLRMVCALVDAKVGPTKLDLMMLEWLKAAGLPWRAVANKADQVKPSRAQARRRDVAQVLGLKPEELAWVSAKAGLGLAGLRAELAARLDS